MIRRDRIRRLIDTQEDSISDGIRLTEAETRSTDIPNALMRVESVGFVDPSYLQVRHRPSPWLLL